MNLQPLLNAGAGFLLGIICAIALMALALPDTRKPILPAGDWHCYQPGTREYRFVRIPPHPQQP